MLAGIAIASNAGKASACTEEGMTHLHADVCVPTTLNLPEDASPDMSAGCICERVQVLTSVVSAVEGSRDVQQSQRVSHSRPASNPCPWISGLFPDARNARST